MTYYKKPHFFHSVYSKHCAEEQEFFFFFLAGCSKSKFTLKSWQNRAVCVNFLEKDVKKEVGEDTCLSIL